MLNGNMYDTHVGTLLNANFQAFNTCAVHAHMRHAWIQLSSRGYVMVFGMRIAGFDHLLMAIVFVPL